MPTTYVEGLPHLGGRLNYVTYGSGTEGTRNRNERNAVRPIDFWCDFDTREELANYARGVSRHFGNRKYEAYEVRVSWSRDELKPENPEDVRAAMEFGRALVDELYPNSPCAITAHGDGIGKCLHLHIDIVNVRDTESLLAIRGRGRKNWEIRAVTDVLCRQRGMRVVRPAPHTGTWAERKEELEAKVRDTTTQLKPGDTWPRSLRDATVALRIGTLIDETIAADARNIRSVEDFESALAKRGVGITRKPLPDGGEGWTYTAEVELEGKMRRRRCKASKILRQFSAPHALATISAEAERQAEADRAAQAEAQALAQASRDAELARREREREHREAQAQTAEDLLRMRRERAREREREREADPRGPERWLQPLRYGDDGRAVLYSFMYENEFLRMRTEPDELQRDLEKRRDEFERRQREGEERQRHEELAKELEQNLERARSQENREALAEIGRAAEAEAEATRGEQRRRRERQEREERQRMEMLARSVRVVPNMRDARVIVNAALVGAEESPWAIGIDEGMVRTFVGYAVSEMPSDVDARLRRELMAWNVDMPHDGKGRPAAHLVATRVAAQMRGGIEGRWEMPTELSSGFAAGFARAMRQADRDGSYGVVQFVCGMFGKFYETIENAYMTVADMVRQTYQEFATLTGRGGSQPSRGAARDVDERTPIAVDGTAPSGVQNGAQTQAAPKRPQRASEGNSGTGGSGVASSRKDVKSLDEMDFGGMNFGE